MRDLVIPTSRLTGKGAKSKSTLVRGLQRAAEAIDQNKPQQFTRDFVKGLRNDFDEDDES